MGEDICQDILKGTLTWLSKVLSLLKVVHMIRIWIREMDQDYLSGLRDRQVDGINEGGWVSG